MCTQYASFHVQNGTILLLHYVILMWCVGNSKLVYYSTLFVKVVEYLRSIFSTLIRSEHLDEVAAFLFHIFLKFFEFPVPQLVLLKRFPRFLSIAINKYNKIHVFTKRNDFKWLSNLCGQIAVAQQLCYYFCISNFETFCCLPFIQPSHNLFRQLICTKPFTIFSYRRFRLLTVRCLKHRCQNQNSYFKVDFKHFTG